MNAICKTLPPPPSPQQQPQQSSYAPPPYNPGAPAPGAIGFDGVSGGHQGPAPYPQGPPPQGYYPPGPPPQGYYQQPFQPQYQQQPYGYASQQEHRKGKGILGGLGNLLGGKGGGGGGGILSSNKGKAAAGLLGGAALGYGASKMIGHGFGGWGLGRHGSWGSMSSFGSSGSFGSIGSFD